MVYNWMVESYCEVNLFYLLKKLAQLMQHPASVYLQYLRL